MNSGATSKYGSVSKRDDGRCVVNFERYLPHPLERVWAAITDPDHLAQWFPGIQLECKQGGRFSIWFSDDHDRPADVIGEVSIYEPPHRLQLGSMYYELRPEGKGCLLLFSDVLYFTGKRSNLWITNSVLAGWHAYLDKLEASLAGHDDVGGIEELDYPGIEVTGRELVNDAPRQD
jgi:hypothetical protein